MSGQSRIKKLALYLLMALLAIFFLFPLVWMISGSLKVETQLYADLNKLTTFLPTPFTLDNYRNMFARTDFFRFLMNSFIITGSTILLGLVVNSLAGYALSRLEFPGRKLVDGSVLALIIVPFEAIFVPLFLIVDWMGGLNS
ncbi:MAG: carbohydrate ABC transporter permease, partial [Candidatus Bipolaricaulia bacterium]